MLLMIFATTSFANGPKKKKVSGFQGTITYKITYEGRELSSQEETQMPNKKVSYYVGSKEIEKTIMPMGYTFTISDRETRDYTIVYDMMGQKFFSKWTKEAKTDSAKTADAENIKIEKFEDTKVIAGYKCKKALVTVKGKDDNEQKITMYYTEDIKTPYPDEEMDLGGMVMQMELLMGDEDDDEALTMVYTVSEVKKGKVKKSEYAIPAGAKEYTKDELKKMFGGGATE